MRYLVTGAHGQLGTEITKLLEKDHADFVAYDSKQLDITDDKKVTTVFEQEKPDVVLHCAAYTKVDPAEEEPGMTTNYRVNVDGTRNVAKASEQINATLVYVSTDYVFDGTNEDEYLETDQVHPMNEYGKRKYEGEKLVTEIMSKYYIIRTSWVFGNYGHNFVYTMLNLAKTHDTLTVVDDQIGRPTWTKTLADFMLYAVDRDLPYGIYQLSNENTANWFEFATEILKDQPVKVLPVTSEEYPQKAYRPRHSVMSLKKVEDTGFVIPTWQEALKQMMANIEN